MNLEKMMIPEWFEARTDSVWPYGKAWRVAEYCFDDFGR